jgi:hypothetical protein
MNTALSAKNLFVIHTEKSKKMQKWFKIYYSIFIQFYLYEAQHVSGNTLSTPVSVQQPHVQQPSTYTKPEAASAVLGS